MGAKKTGEPSERFVLCVLDFTIVGVVSGMEDAMQNASSICYNVDANAIWLKLPLAYRAQPFTVALQAWRRIEDLLTQFGVELDKGRSIHYVMQDMRENDRRHFSAQGRPSATNAASPPWAKSRAARSKIADVPLCKVSRMRAWVVDGKPDPHKISLAARVAHQGNDACMVELLEVSAGFGMTRKGKLTIVDFKLVINGQWMHAAL